MKIIVQMTDADGTLHASIDRADLHRVACWLAHVRLARTGLDAGQAMTEFLDAAGCSARLTLRPDQADLLVCLRCDCYGVPVLGVLQGQTLLFQGSRDGLMGFARDYHGDLAGKTVVFRYLGGSAVGNRLVKVDKVAFHNGGRYIHGTDVRKGEYRQYDCRHIDGEVLVVSDLLESA